MNKIYTSKLICCLITGCTKYLIVVLIPAIPIRALRIFVRGRLGIVSVTPLTQRAYKTRWQTAVTQIQSEGFWEMTWTTCSKICCLISFLLSKHSLSILLLKKKFKTVKSCMTKFKKSTMYNRHNNYLWFTVNQLLFACKNIS